VQTPSLPKGTNKRKKETIMGRERRGATTKIGRLEEGKQISRKTSEQKMHNAQRISSLVHQNNNRDNVAIRVISVQEGAVSISMTTRMNSGGQVPSSQRKKVN